MENHRFLEWFSIDNGGSLFIKDLVVTFNYAIIPIMWKKVGAHTVSGSFTRTAIRE